MLFCCYCCYSAVAASAVAVAFDVALKTFFVFFDLFRTVKYVNFKRTDILIFLSRCRAVEPALVYSIFNTETRMNCTIKQNKRTGTIQIFLVFFFNLLL